MHHRTHNTELLHHSPTGHLTQHSLSKQCGTDHHLTEQVKGQPQMTNDVVAVCRQLAAVSNSHEAGTGKPPQTAVINFHHPG